jgi:hypothetical protein
VRRWFLAAALALVPLLAADSLAQTPKKGPLDKLVDKATDKDDKCKDGCSRHGTKIDFYKSPSEAAAAARKAENLVLVLHVSGHFEDPTFT